MPGRILLVGDDRAIGTAAAALRAEGHRVLRAEAVDRASWGVNGRVDGVVLDLNVPSLDGLDALARLRAVEGLRETPVAVITGDHLMDEDVSDQFEALGASVYFKPVWVDELTTIARRLVARAQRCPRVLRQETPANGKLQGEAGPMKRPRFG